MKTFLVDAFVNKDKKTYHLVNDFFALLTLLSIVSVVLETVPTMQEYSKLFIIVEWTAVTLFTFEYIGRTLVEKKLHKYPVSFFGMIDLLAILPTFLGLGNFTFLKSARALRIIRLLRMFRLAKIARASSSKGKKFNPLSLNILLYLATLTFALLITGTFMYLTESPESAFISIPAAMWWSFKVFVGSIAVPQPITEIGGAVYVFTRFIGLLLLGLLIGIVGNIFRSVMLGEE